FRLSPQQLRLWALQEQDGSALYRSYCSIEIEGEADSVRVRRALDAIVGRHEILRTTFRRLPGMSSPLQVVHERLPVVFEEQVGDGAESLSAWVRGRRDLTEGAVLTALLRRSAADRATLFLELPALCADRTTLERIVFELGALCGEPGSQRSVGRASS